MKLIQKDQKEITNNIVAVLANKIKDFSFRFKSNEKEFFSKIKDFHGDSQAVSDKYFKNLQGEMTQ